MEEKIKLLLEYIKKDKEIMKENYRAMGASDEVEDCKLPVSANIERVKNFIAYRNVRVEESWFQKLHNGDNSRRVKEELCELDAKRSRRHADALVSVQQLNEFSQIHDLPLFYEGELVTGSDIENYVNIDTRKKETDFFLQFIDELSRTPSIVMDRYFKETGIDKESEMPDFIKELQGNVEEVDLEYGVEKNLTEDDGDIVFKDEDALSRHER